MEAAGEHAHALVFRSMVLASCVCCSWEQAHATGCVTLLGSIPANHFVHSHSCCGVIGGDAPYVSSCAASLCIMWQQLAVYPGEVQQSARSGAPEVDLVQGFVVEVLLQIAELK
jgi:hypothetical protein